MIWSEYHLYPLLVETIPTRFGWYSQYFGNILQKEKKLTILKGFALQANAKKKQWGCTLFYKNQ